MVRLRQRRRPNEMRPLHVTYDMYAFASGSTLFEIGNTKVLCAVTLQNGVPYFLRGKQAGWLTAEYAMLPASTPVRTARETAVNKRNGRTIEIARLIGRSLRSVTRLDLLGERTIFVDCDVLQADGSTRTACVTGAYLALKAAEKRWLYEGLLSESLITEELMAVSVGWRGDEALLDIDYAEDSSISADFNFVLTRAARLVEIQGTSEGNPILWEQFDQLRAVALLGVEQLGHFFDENSYALPPAHSSDRSLAPFSKHHQYHHEMI